MSLSHGAKILTRLDEVEVLDGPHQGHLMRLPAGLLWFGIPHPVDRWIILTYSRQSDRTPEGRVGFKLS